MRYRRSSVQVTIASIPLVLGLLLLPQTSIAAASAVQTPAAGAFQSRSLSSEPGPVSADATPSAPATPAITAPLNGAKTRLLQTTVGVTISDDTTRVSIWRGGIEVASLVTSATTSAVLPNVPLRYGFNMLQARAENSEGSTTSTAVTIKVVAPVGAPVFRNVFYRKVFYRPHPTVTGKTRNNTLGVELYLNGRRIRRLSVASWKVFSFRRVPLRYGMNRISMVAYNEFYRKGTGTFRVWRLDIRANFRTLVVVDKSERHVYFIKNYKLISYYPCAIGKPSTPTPERVWRIDSKEYTDPSSAYGPRRMRLFKRIRSGSRYVYEYTAYGIHGTNTPSSIGHMASHGCIRLYSRDILRLFPLVPLHTYVVTRY